MYIHVVSKMFIFHRLVGVRNVKAPQAPICWTKWLPQCSGVPLPAFFPLLATHFNWFYLYTMSTSKYQRHSRVICLLPLCNPLQLIWLWPESSSPRNRHPMKSDTAWFQSHCHWPNFHLIYSSFTVHTRAEKLDFWKSISKVDAQGALNRLYPTFT